MRQNTYILSCQAQKMLNSVRKIDKVLAKPPCDNDSDIETNNGTDLDPIGSIDLLGDQITCFNTSLVDRLVRVECLEEDSLKTGQDNGPSCKIWSSLAVDGCGGYYGQVS